MVTTTIKKDRSLSNAAASTIYMSTIMNAIREATLQDQDSIIDLQIVAFKGCLPQSRALVLSTLELPRQNFFGKSRTPSNA